MEGDLQRAVGRTLRAYRQARDLSQEAFAEAVGVHRTYLGGLERGERNLTLRSVERLAERLGVPPLRMLEGAPEPPPVPTAPTTAAVPTTPTAPGTPGAGKAGPPVTHAQQAHRA